MSLPKSVVLLTGAATLTLAGVGGAATTDTNRDAMNEINALKERLAQLETQENSNWLTEQRATEIRSLVQDVLADADTRASLQDTNMTAGYDDGFFIRSQDGNYSVHINGGAQVRFNWNSTKSGALGTPANRWGFENTRTRLVFSGNVIDPTWTYRIQAQWSDSVGDTTGGPAVIGAPNATGFHLQDAWIQKDMGNGLSLKVGQFKAPFAREYMVDEFNQLAVERSLLSTGWQHGRMQGIQMGYAADAIRFAGYFGDGVGGMLSRGSQNTNWTMTPTRYSMGGRFEFKSGGTWDQFDDMSSHRGEEFAMLFGVATFYQSNYANSPSHTWEMTADATIDGGGWNLMAAFYIGQLKPGGGASSTTPWGFTAQGGYFLTDDLEAFARWEYGKKGMTGAGQVAATNLNGFTLGANWFFGDNMKFTGDFGLNLKTLDGSVGTETGYQAQTGGGSKNQWAIRMQMQVTF